MLIRGARVRRIAGTRAALGDDTMKKLILKTTTLKTLDNAAQLEAVAGGAAGTRYLCPRPRSASPFLCVPPGEGAGQ